VTLNNVTDGVSHPHVREVIGTNGPIDMQTQLDALRRDLAELHAEFTTYRTQNATALSYILASLDHLQNRPPRVLFRWWWEEREKRAQ
jgi:hypothetical protein